MEQREKRVDRISTQSCNVKQMKARSHYTSCFHLQGMSLFFYLLVCYVLKMPGVNQREANSVLGKSSMLRLSAAAPALGISQRSFPREAKAERFSSISLPSGANAWRTAQTHTKQWKNGRGGIHIGQLGQLTASVYRLPFQLVGRNSRLQRVTRFIPPHVRSILPQVPDST